LSIKPVAEELICASGIAFANGPRSTEESPAGQADADGYEGFFLKPAAEFLEPVFFVEISGRRVSPLK